MKNSRYVKRFCMGLAVAMLVVCGGSTLAQSYDPDQDIPKPTVFQKRIEKLGRGLTNILFGWTEIPLTWHDGVQRHKALTEIIGTSTIKGITKALLRTGTGVYETVTFPADTNQNAYEPMLEPEYLF